MPTEPSEQLIERLQQIKGTAKILGAQALFGEAEPVEGDRP